jgi:hypothetical protein
MCTHLKRKELEQAVHSKKVDVEDCPATIKDRARAPPSLGIEVSMGGLLLIEHGSLLPQA